MSAGAAVSNDGEVPDHGRGPAARAGVPRAGRAGALPHRPADHLQAAALHHLADTRYTYY